MSTVTGTVASTPAVTTPAVTATSTPKALPHAANGTDVRACSGGSCEVLVTGPVALPLDARFGLSSLSVQDITAAGVDFGAVASDGTILNLYQQRPDQGGASVVGNLAIAVVACDGHAAVIKLSPTRG